MDSHNLLPPKTKCGCYQKKNYNFSCWFFFQCPLQASIEEMKGTCLRTRMPWTEGRSPLPLSSPSMNFPPVQHAFFPIGIHLFSCIALLSFIVELKIASMGVPKRSPIRYRCDQTQASLEHGGCFTSLQSICQTHCPTFSH